MGDSLLHHLGLPLVIKNQNRDHEVSQIAVDARVTAFVNEYKHSRLSETQFIYTAVFLSSLRCVVAVVVING